eukprot:3259566-Pleurochrysis_carterae.AAC.1
MEAALRAKPPGGAERRRDRSGGSKVANRRSLTIIGCREIASVGEGAGAASDWRARALRAGVARGAGKVASLSFKVL